MVRERPVRVAHVVGNFTTGSGGITLREALALDGGRYRSAIIAPEGGTLTRRAEEAGLEVMELSRMGTGRHVYPHDVAALREIASLLSAGRFDIVHTHARPRRCPGPDRRSSAGRARHRPHLSRVPVQRVPVATDAERAEDDRAETGADHRLLPHGRHARRVGGHSAEDRST